MAKGTVSRDFFIRFFCQTDPPSPVRDVPGPFLILMIFHRDIQILNWLPDVLYTGELRLWGSPMHWKIETPQCPMYWGVLPFKSQNTLSWLSGVPSTGEMWLCGVLCTWELQSVHFLFFPKCSRKCFLQIDLYGYQKTQKFYADSKSEDKTGKCARINLIFV